MGGGQAAASLCVCVCVCVCNWPLPITNQGMYPMSFSFVFSFLPSLYSLPAPSTSPFLPLPHSPVLRAAGASSATAASRAAQAGSIVPVLVAAALVKAQITKSIILY